MLRPSLVVAGVLLFSTLSGAAASAFAVMSDAPNESLPPPIPGEPVKKPPAGKKQVEPRPSRGQLLYENHCTGCHTSVAHIRDDRRVRTLKELETWVARWAGERGLPWGAGDVADVVQYLDRHFYHFTSNGSTR